MLLLPGPALCFPGHQRDFGVCGKPYDQKEYINNDIHRGRIQDCHSHYTAIGSGFILVGSTLKSRSPLLRQKIIKLVPQYRNLPTTLSSLLFQVVVVWLDVLLSRCANSPGSRTRTQTKGKPEFRKQ